MTSWISDCSSAADQVLPQLNFSRKSSMWVKPQNMVQAACTFGSPHHVRNLKTAEQTKAEKQIACDLRFGRQHVATRIPIMLKERREK